MMKALQTRPAPQGWNDYSRSHLNKGPDYHRAFVARPGRALMWDLERRLLRDMIARIRPRVVLDYATGTGRVAGFVKQAAPWSEVHGVDISESMLSVAYANVSGVAFHLLDGRTASERFGPDRFDLVTAFRFFANADDELRERSAAGIRAMVRPGGWVIFNNHRNFWSISYFLARVGGRGGRGAENDRLERLFIDRGFEVVERRSLGVWPHGERRTYGLPWRLTRRFEEANLRWTSERHALGYNTIWLLRKV